jgi:hypothetical protein
MHAFTFQEVLRPYVMNCTIISLSIPKLYHFSLLSQDAKLTADDYTSCGILRPRLLILPDHRAQKEGEHEGPCNHKFETLDYLSIINTQNCERT